MQSFVQFGNHMDNSVAFVAVALAFVALLSLFLAVAALFRRRPLRSFTALLVSLLLFTAAGLLAALTVATIGYKALTREETAALIAVTPTGPQRFEAWVRFADGSERRFELAGDEVYVDAHILKWTPTANLFGLHTAYELSRIAGRYHRLEDERSAPRTVHSLAAEKPIDLFRLRRRYAFLAPLVDAEYGSATFILADRPAQFELRVSATGLLIREAPMFGNQPPAKR
ncbi:MAG: hypothetical protein ACOZDY_12605 [Pseudomonadota bacterium]